MVIATSLARSRRARLVTLVSSSLLLGLTPGAEAQDTSGAPLNGTITLSGGFLPDPHVVPIVPGGGTEVPDHGAGCSGYIFAEQPDLEVVLENAGSQLGIFVRSDLDTTLVVNDPDGNWHCNDDFAEAGAANPGILFDTPAGGTYDIWVGTFEDAGTEGSGQLVVTEYDSAQWAGLDLGDGSSAVATAGGTSVDGIDFGDDLSTWANDGECDDPRFAGEGVAGTLADSDLYHDATDCSTLYRSGAITLAGGTAVTGTEAIQRGRLEAGDSVDPNDSSYIDLYTFSGDAGATAVLDLRSAEFDTYLRVVAPSGEVFTNDDYEGSQERSLVSMQLGESGEYRVEVTSYEGGQSGAYTLEMLDSVATTATSQLANTGTLGSGDSTYSDGEYFDSYTFEGSPGQTVTIDLESADFDTYLILEAPNGETEVNDDLDSTSHSQLVTQLSEVGTYTVHVTSYGAAESGAYELNIAYGAASPGPSRDSINIAFGESYEGALDSGDQRSGDGKYEDVYAFSGEAGETVRVTLDSAAFDTYLSVITPGGQAIDNDDFDGSTSRSVVEFTLQESGRYRILATTYGSDITGSYALALGAGSASGVVNVPVAGGGARIYGIFAGVADYPGEANDLDLTDQDAMRAHDALIAGAGMAADDAYLLLNEEATNGNFRSALGRIGSTIGQDDMLVIFYSGHGNRIERPDGPNNSDPDGLDESIELYDGSLLDDELAQLLDGIDAGRVLLVFDSCFSGGFAKDVVSAPGRMGLFSSEEDVTSQVAFKFQAGGYLAVFFEEAMNGYADVDGNRELTALELSEYLHGRYRADVKAFGSDDYVQTSGPQSSYQHLVVDRGGVGAYNVLFRQ